MLYSHSYTFCGTCKLLQGEMHQPSINNVIQLIMKSTTVMAMAFSIHVPGSCVYIYIAVAMSLKSTGTFLFM